LDIKELLIKLTNLNIPSGSETQNNFLLKEFFGEFCDDIKCDKMGNIIGLKKGLNGCFSLMLAAHMDEIGLMVKQIDSNGFIRFTNLGGVDQRILPAQQVVIHGKIDLPGIIGNKPLHIQDQSERHKSIKAEDMFIDTGLPTSEVEKYVCIGDYITFKRNQVELYNKCFSANALDDRAGIATVLYALDELGHLKFDSNVFAVATSQEELGLRGAIVSSYSIAPNVAIAIDVCHGNMPGLPEEETHKLGEGPVLSVGPNIHAKLYRRLKEVCEDFKLSFQVNPEPSSTGTDAWAIQITREGIPTALISIPLRYMHTSVETLCIDDIKTAGRLLALFISSLDKKFVEELSCF
jgi:putative aminopeptidase FrvX